MFRIVFGVFMALASAAAHAEWIEVFIEGRVTSYETYSGSQWVDAMEAIGNPSLVSRVQVWMSPSPCIWGPSNSCGSYASDGYGPLSVTNLTTLGGLHHAPGAGTCSPVAPTDCWPLNQWSFSRGNPDTASFSEQTKDYFYTGDIELHHQAVYYSLVGDFIPNGSIAFGQSLASLNESVAGAGSFFSYLYSDAEVVLAAGYRGTFEITSAHVPTPGTLALLGLGALGLALRRRH